MSSLAPTGIYNGPTSLVMSITQNSARKGIAQHVAVANGSTYIGSLWIRPDREAAFRVEAVPESGATTIANYTLTPFVWNLVSVTWAASAQGYGDIQYTTGDLGLYEMSCAQFCRKIDLYDPLECVIPNEWSRGGLGDSTSSTVTIERFDDVSPFDWADVLRESFGDVSSYAQKSLTGGALTYTVRDLYFPLDTDLYYRARVDNIGVGVSSPDSGASPVPAISDNRWLLVPSLPGRTGAADSGDVLRVNVQNEKFESESNSNAGVFWALGRKMAIVVSDSTVSGEEGEPLELAFSDPYAYAIFERIREANCPVLLRAGRYGFSRWIRFVGKRKQSIFLGTGNVRPVVRTDWVEVDPPESA